MKFRVIGSSFLALLSLAAFTACGSDDEKPKEKPPGSVGTGCNPDSPACNDGLVCSPRASGDALCTFAAGDVCKPTDDTLANGGCSESAECVKRDDEGDPVCLLTETSVCDPVDDQCSNGLSCARTEDEEYRCFGEVVLRGAVTDTTTTEGIPDAHVLAIDEEGIAVTDVAISDELGNYELEIPVVRAADGTPIAETFTLRAAAQDYQPFPSGIRVALPITASDAAREDEVYAIENALTAIGLIPIEEGERTTISGSVVALEGDAAGEVGGVLVVASGDDGAFSALTDRDGDFTIFNVPPGEYVLNGYAADIQIGSAEATVEADPVVDVELLELEDALATVTGNVQIVNATGESVTSVILVVEETFDPNAARGEVPRGLRAPRSGAPDVTGDFTISGVPAGNYVVLAAYENDDLVRDPDTNIAGTDFVSIVVPVGEETIALAESFKVTQALATIGPGTDGPEAVTEAPMLEWADDSSEDYYDLRVFDALGNEVWSSLMLPAVSGEETVSVQYEGPLDPGMYYQFRVSSWRAPGGMDPAPISMTEDLRGVFFLPAE